MNYFSHYYIDRDHPSPYFKLGTILPDIYRHFNAVLRKPMFSPGIVWNNEHRYLVDGVKKHYYIDSIFHNLPRFKEWMILLERKMGEKPLTGSYERRYFLVHIWVELILDRLLIREKPEIVSQFYADMRRVNEQVVQGAFEQMGKEKEGLVFFANFKAVIGNEYLFMYSDNEMFTRALLNIYQRTVRTVVPQEDRPFISAITLEAEQLLAPHLDELFFNLSS